MNLGSLLVVQSGTATMEDLDTFVQTRQRTRRIIYLNSTHIVVPSGEEHTLRRVRRERLLRPNNNVHIVGPNWRTPTGEVYEWTDG